MIRKGFIDKVRLHVSLQNRKKLGRKSELKKKRTKKEAGINSISTYTGKYKHTQYFHHLMSPE